LYAWRREAGMTHRRAVALMVCATLLWSIAGVVTRHLTPELQQKGRFELTFWRSFFAAVFVAGYLLLAPRSGGLRAVVQAGWPGFISGLCWATMYSAFMLALTLTTTANALVVLSVGPLVAALLARMVLGTRIDGRTWVAIAAATLGIGWMFSQDAAVLGGRHLAGMVMAFAVPLAAAVNLVTLQRMRRRVDFIPAVFLGGALSALAMLPFAFPSLVNTHDIALLALLGFFQLGLPCMFLVVVARSLPAHEIALLALLEVIFGTLWAWIGAGEAPTPATLVGGAIVLAALALNELAATRRDAAGASA
jgi:drug/metabolite transporter (DMT)-like permease